MAHSAQLTHHRYDTKKVAINLFLVVVIVLVGLRLYLPIWLKDYVNRTLNNIPGYAGSVEDVNVHLYRGAYTIQGLKLDKTGTKVPVPFLDIADIDLSIEWHSLLFYGRIVSEVYLTNAQINIVINDGRAVQTGTEVDWTKPIDDLMPIDINFVQLNGGKITYNDYAASPDIRLFIKNIDGRVTNLRNVVDKNVALPSDLRISGESIGKGKMLIEGKVNAIRKVPDFDIDAQLEHADLTSLNDYFREFAGIDFSRGEISIYSELVSKDENIRGYVKPLMTNIQVVDLQQENNPVELFWETLVSIVMELLENQPKDQFATRIPVSGTWEDMRTASWPAFIAILQNAFIEAFKNNTDDSVSYFKRKDMSAGTSSDKDNGWDVEYVYPNSNPDLTRNP